MRSFLPTLFLLMCSITILTACGNKPVQLELPSETPTTAENAAPTGN